MADSPPGTISTALWEQVAPLVPSSPSHAKGGRPRMSDRQAFEAIVYILRTGIPWNALPPEMGACSTVHDRFLAWRRQGFFQALQHAGLWAADELKGIDWERKGADKAEFFRHTLVPLKDERQTVAVTDLRQAHRY
jgi:putative transposase